MFEAYERLAERALRDEPPSESEALAILDGKDVALLPLLHAAFVPRERYFGRKVMVHMLNNVQNGLCPENCGYCAQNKDSSAPIRKYAMKTDEEVFAEAENAARAGATRYCMVLSGRGPTLERTRKLALLIRRLKDRYPIGFCLSVGLVDDEQAKILAEAGLDRLNHNLNTSEEHYEKICTTHGYADRVQTLLAAKRHGLESCSGLILGMGESSRDVVEVALRLRELEVPSIPVNFLIPIDGNQVVSDGSLTPERCLRALALMRLVNPRAEIRAAGGREGHLRALGPLALWPANSLFVDGYLTTRGDGVRATYRMIRDAGFEIDGNPAYERELFEGEGAAEGFRLEGEAPLFKPEIARATRGVG
ncbi:biotin synthase [Myxococcaceae bacterium]|nr:biotin synthase [Myxococcaceae bacterium]